MTKVSCVSVMMFKCKSRGGESVISLVSLVANYVLTHTPITTICQSVDRLANGALFTVRSTGTPIVHRLSLDQPVHQSIAASFNRTTNMQPTMCSYIFQVINIYANLIIQGNNYCSNILHNK